MADILAQRQTIMSSLLAELPAASLSLAAVIFAEQPHRCLLQLRAKADCPGLAKGLADVHAPPLPDYNRFTENPDWRLLRLGPDEWLLAGNAGSNRDGKAKEYAGIIHSHLSGRGAVVDWSESRASLSLSGPEARGLMMRACPLDLHPSAFASGHCAQTRLAQAPGLFWQSDAAPRYEILILNSYSEYLWRWLLTSLASRGLEATRET